jgi:endogenous inhibitor of DNA gyrase (YacG/DUF329 family)
MSAPNYCPICKREVPGDEEAPRPFCSARCRAIDLGSWLDERYRIATVSEEDEDGLSPAPSADDDGADS